MTRSTHNKVLPRARAIRRRQQWRRAGERTVFTNGVFDILHAGHIRLLEAARAMGDRLIVGVNSDASVRRLDKGSERPINALADRCRVLAALDCVDAVVGFGEDTPEQLLKHIRPDILVKGADYRVHEVAGRQYAGKVALVPLKKGYSTTKIVGKLSKPK